MIFLDVQVFFFQGKNNNLKKENNKCVFKILIKIRVGEKLNERERDGERERNRENPEGPSPKQQAGKDIKSSPLSSPFVLPLSLLITKLGRRILKRTEPSSPLLTLQSAP